VPGRQTRMGAPRSFLGVDLRVHVDAVGFDMLRVEVPEGFRAGALVARCGRYFPQIFVCLIIRAHRQLSLMSPKISTD
jgi:hypothetical protein